MRVQGVGTRADAEREVPFRRLWGRHTLRDPHRDREVPTLQGSGFRVQGSGFRVQGVGFRVQGAGFTMRAAACAALVGARRSDTEAVWGFWVCGSGLRVEG